MLTGAGDLGRRLAEQRQRCGLSRAETADRAGVAVSYLETSATADPGPDVLIRLVAVPVNYRMLGDDIVFRTSESGSRAAAARQPRVSFSVDHIDDALAEGWSVLARGEAAAITDPGPGWPRPAGWASSPGPTASRDVCIRLTSREITGRCTRAVQ